MPEWTVRARPTQGTPYKAWQPPPAKRGPAYSAEDQAWWEGHPCRVGVVAVQAWLHTRRLKICIYIMRIISITVRERNYKYKKAEN